jgi:hypothetical protein
MSELRSIGNFKKCVPERPGEVKNLWTRLCALLSLLRSLHGEVDGGVGDEGSRRPRAAERVRRPARRGLHCNRKSGLYIPRNETARPRSQFLHSCNCERFIYFQGSVCLFGCSKLGRPILGMYKSLTDTLSGNWETEHYNSVLEITRPRSFISGNTKIETRHFYWILPALHLQCIMSIHWQVYMRTEIGSGKNSLKYMSMVNKH